jgi:Coenzyme PQQ synthesis protein D (PqqD)
LRQNPGMEASELNGELLLFDGATNKFFVMNPTAAFVWNRIGQPTPPADEELASALCTNFAGATQEQALQDVKETLKNMVELGLVLER